MEAQQPRVSGATVSEWEKKPTLSHSIQSAQNSSDSYALRPLSLVLTGSRDVMLKLLAFTGGMIILPLATFWLSLNYIFHGI
jgi:hypothetical protein